MVKRKQKIDVWVHVCPATGHGILGRQNIGRLTALMPLCLWGRCWASGKCQDTTLGVGKHRLRCGEADDSWRIPKACDKAGAEEVIRLLNIQVPVGVGEELRTELADL